ncbi:MAG: BMC domain-containing protein [Ignavibacteriales bacterium]|nr:BMC domain-containing protein [Ignavibacteriales bacterium]
MSNSIGLIESKGLVALIEAADVILKNSPVKILGIHKLENGLVTLAVSGDSEYVKTAIESGTEAGRRVGEIYSFSVVDNPSKVLLDIFSDLFPTDEESKTLNETDSVTKIISSDQILNKNSNNIPTTNVKPKTESKREKSKPLQVTKITPIHKVLKSKDQSNQENKIKDNSSTIKVEDVKTEFDKTSEEIDKETETTKPISTIERLRIEALGLGSKENKTNDIGAQSKKKKEKANNKIQLNEKSEINFDAISQMNVHKLRHYARAFPNFPIKGREISRANRNELVELFKNIKNN